METNSIVMSKKAFFHNGNRVRDYIYDHSKVTDTTTIMWNDDTLEIFNNNDGYCLYGTDNDTTFHVYDNIIIVKKNSLQGAVTLEGRYDLIPIKYSKIEYISNHLITSLNGKKGLYGVDGLHILDEIYDEINIMQHYIEVVLDGKHGLFSLNGTRLIEPLYDKFSFGLPAIAGYIGNTRHSAYSFTGKKFFDYAEIDQFYGIKYGFIVTRGKKWGLFAHNGDCILPIEYDNIYIEDSFKTKYIVIQKDGKTGISSLEGKTILPLEFAKIRLGVRTKDGFISSKYISVFNEDKWGVYSYDSSLVLPVIFDDVLEFDEVVSKVVLDGKIGYYILKSKKFIEASDFNITKTGIYEIKVNEKWEILKLN